MCIRDRVGHAQEVQSYRAEIERLEREYAELQSNARTSQNGQQAPLRDDLERIANLLATARRDLARSYLNRLPARQT